MGLQGEVVEQQKLSEKDRQLMFALMEKHYDDLEYQVFLNDLAEKDYCIILSEHGELKGFSTQKLMSFEVHGREITGVFSGDTIIDRDSWGSIELYKVFARFFIAYGEKYPNFYWFLISKGYKTYKMLPLFFNEFYPNYQNETPKEMQEIMDTFGEYKYPLEYDIATGVVCYRGVKDKLKPGVADITAKHLQDEDIRYFVARNPGHLVGNDLVCLAELKLKNLKPATQRLLLRKTSHEK